MAQTPEASGTPSTAPVGPLNGLFSKPAWESFFIGVGIGLVVWCLHSPLSGWWGSNPTRTATPCNWSGALFFSLLFIYRTREQSSRLVRIAGFLAFAAGAGILTTKGGLPSAMEGVVTYLGTDNPPTEAHVFASIGYMLAYGLLGLIATSILAIFLEDPKHSTRIQRRQSRTNTDAGAWTKGNFLRRPPVLVTISAAIGGGTVYLATKLIGGATTDNVQIAYRAQPADSTNCDCNAKPVPPKRDTLSRFTREGYGRKGPWKGWIFTVAEDGDVSPKCDPKSCEPPWGKETCVAGSVLGADTSAGRPHPFVMFGWNINQDASGKAASDWAVAGRGIRVEVVNFTSSTLRVQAQDLTGNLRWCAKLESENSFIPWANFTTTCWDSNQPGEALRIGTKIAQLAIVAPGGQRETPVNFCAVDFELDENSERSAASHGNPGTLEKPNAAKRPSMSPSEPPQPPSDSTEPLPPPAAETTSPAAPVAQPIRARSPKSVESDNPY